MAKKMKILTAIFAILFVVFFIAYNLTQNQLLLSLTITVATLFYHLFMRLLVGAIINRIFNNKIDYNKPWYKQRKFEIKLYKFLKVKKWKQFMPTYAPETFSVKQKTTEQIIMASCQAEIVHFIIVILSFLPIIASVWFNGFWAFVITSLISAFIDTAFIIMQRFNRPRLFKILQLKKLTKGG